MTNTEASIAHLSSGLNETAINLLAIITQVLTTTGKPVTVDSLRALCTGTRSILADCRQRPMSAWAEERVTACTAACDDVLAALGGVRGFELDAL